MQVQNLEPLQVAQHLAHAGKPPSAGGETTRTADGEYCATNSVPLQQFLAGKA